MIRRLKRKYTLIVMCAVIGVLGLIITAINVSNYTFINSLLDDKLTMLVRNEGMMPEFPPVEKPDEDEGEAEGPENNIPEDQDPLENEQPLPDENTPPENGDTPSDEELNNGDTEPSPEETPEEEEEEDPRQNMSPETPFETRYFSVKFNTDGTVFAIDTTKIAAIDAREAESYAKDLLDSGKEKGYVGTYKFMQGPTEDGKILYVFLDAARELNSYRSFLVSSLVISFLGILLVFTLVVLLSDVALRPIIESYEKQKRFITDAGHEMKTPLTVISANAEVIEMESGESQWTEGIKSQVAKLASLTEKLVILSKMEEGAKLDMNQFNLSEAVYDTCDQYKSSAMSKMVRFDLDVPDDILMMGNEAEIRRCVSLILDNAFRYVSDDGYVSVKVQKLPSGVEMRFVNSADETDKGSLDRWFDRFYRTDLSRNSATGGSGIGLSVVKAIVNAHGGAVHARSEDGRSVEIVINI